jgi:hypothetical protein
MMALETEDIMNISDLEKSELVDLTAMLGGRLARSVEAELALAIRVKGLERAVDAARKEVFWENRAKQLSVEAQGWEESAKQTEALLYETRNDLANAKEQAEARRRNFQEAMEQRDHAFGERDKAKAELNSVKALNAALASDHLKASSEWKADREVFRANEKRLERELRECRATVMNEISAMIPKAVEAERKACAEIARNVALLSQDEVVSATAMKILNIMKTRGQK